MTYVHNDSSPGLLNVSQIMIFGNDTITTFVPHFKMRYHYLILIDLNRTGVGSSSTTSGLHRPTDGASPSDSNGSPSTPTRTNSNIKATHTAVKIGTPLGLLALTMLVIGSVLCSKMIRRRRKLLAPADTQLSLTGKDNESQSVTPIAAPRHRQKRREKPTDRHISMADSEFTLVRGADVLGGLSIQRPVSEARVEKATSLSDDAIRGPPSDGNNSRMRRIQDRLEAVERFVIDSLARGEQTEEAEAPPSYVTDD